ncbi:MAG: prolipoprotein diacylglyceryl transferase [Phycisphaerae bacterium]|nr:prolipoprotein diacylglyceryl transferase [Phycisphaerae bacterium]
MRQIIIAFGTLKFGGFEFPLRVYGYGLMLVLGFLVGILLARWRAKRAGEDPEVISQLAIFALLGGVGGARLAYIIKEWDTYRHAGIGELLNITSGGLIYFGGLLGGAGLVILGLFLKRVPVRRFLDLFAMTIMVGLAFGRMGCLLNGCCWGGPCDDHWALATHFPMMSRPLVNLGESRGGYLPGQSPCPAYSGEYSEGRIVPDLRLVNPYAPYWETDENGESIQRYTPLPVEQLHGLLTTDQLTTMFGTSDDAYQAFQKIAGPDKMIDRDEWAQARQQGDGFLRGSESWAEAIRFGPEDMNGYDSGPMSFENAWRYLQARKDILLKRFDTDGDKNLNAQERQAANEYLQADLWALLGKQRTNALRPAQVLGICNALLLAGLLVLFYRHRRREGRVFALMLILYPITRFILESIRNVDPLNVFHGNWTHNQISSLVLVFLGAAMWWWTARRPASAGPTLLERLAKA